MMNNISIVGRLTADPQLRYTPAGVATTTITLAVNRPFKNAAGENEADFINVVIWRKPAENTANFLKKGSLAGITGRIQTRNYENQEGRKVYVTEVVAEHIAFLDTVKRPTTGVEDPFEGGETVDVSDDDLPF